MALLVLDRDVEASLKAERKSSGADRYDEVWDGVYHMSPLAGNEHQGIASRFAIVLGIVIELPGLGLVRAGVNVSDREEGWLYNYRIPDVAVFLPGTSAKDCDTHWCGGPDFAVEICSPDDETREKLGFYEKVGVRELLLLDRDPWVLELYQLRGASLVLVGTSRPDAPASLTSALLPLSFRLIAGDPRPGIEVRHADGVQHWVV